MQCPDHGLVVAIVAEHALGAVDTAGEGGLGDDAAVPDRIDQLILADDPVVVFHQVNDEIENLGFDMNERALPAKLLLAEVDLELGEPVLHGNFLE